MEKHLHTIWPPIRKRLTSPPWDRLFDRRGLGLAYRRELRPNDLACSQTLSRAQLLLQEHSPQVCILNGLRHAFIRELAKEKEFANTKWFLDTGDILHTRTASMHSTGIPNWITISQREEVQELMPFDGIIAVAEHEQSTLSAMLRGHPVHLMSLAIPLVTMPEPKSDGVSIGFLSTGSNKNVKSLRWFIECVWGELRKRHPEATLHAFGSICNDFPESALEGIRVEGEVDLPEDAYRRVHIAINPIQCGAGLQIKSVQAIACNRPLVTTSLGAKGICPEGSDGVLVANTPDEWMDHLESLIEDPELRKSQSLKGQEIVKKHFSHEAAFGKAWRELSRNLPSR